MVILLKILLGILVLAEILVGRVMVSDWLSTKKSQNFEEGTLYSRFVTNLTFGFIMVALLMMAVFLVWIISSPVTIG